MQCLCSGMKLLQGQAAALALLEMSDVLHMAFSGLPWGAPSWSLLPLPAWPGTSRGTVELRRRRALTLLSVAWSRAHLRDRSFCSVVAVPSLVRVPTRQRAGALTLRLAQTGAPRQRALGYWSSVETVAREVREFCQAHGIEPDGRLPTEYELLRARPRRYDLVRAIKKHGGFRRVAAAIGMRTTSDMQQPRDGSAPLLRRVSGQVRARNYWIWENMRRELLQYMEQRSEAPNIAPSVGELIAAYRHDLAKAVDKFGGIRALSRRLDVLARSQAPSPYADFDYVRHQVVQVAQAAGLNAGLMPSLSQLYLYGSPSLLKPIATHGGVAAVAKRMGLALQRELPEAAKPAHYWTQERLDEEARDLVRSSGRVPNKAEMVAAGRNDLLIAAHKHGGLRALWKRLGVQSGAGAIADGQPETLRREPKPMGYWTQERVDDELRAFADAHGGTLSHSALLTAGRGDLLGASKKFGGLRAARQRLRSAPPEMQRSRAEWRPWGFWTKARVCDELRAFVRLHGTRPTYRALLRAGMGPLSAAARRYGGLQRVLREMTAAGEFIPGIDASTPMHKPGGYWTQLTIDRELREMAKQLQRIPTLKDLYMAVRRDVISAATARGGLRAARRRLAQMWPVYFPNDPNPPPVPPERKPARYWTLETTDREVRAFLAHHGLIGASVLMRAGRSDLAEAIRKFGGMQAAVERHGLVRIPKTHNYRPGVVT